MIRYPYPRLSATTGMLFIVLFEQEATLGYVKLAQRLDDHAAAG